MSAGQVMGALYSKMDSYRSSHGLQRLCLAPRILRLLSQLSEGSVTDA